MSEFTRWQGVPSTDEARTYIERLASDDCPWMLVDAALDEIDRLRSELAKAPSAPSADALVASVFAHADRIGAAVEVLRPLADQVDVLPVLRALGVISEP